jgi:hypothetical protein
VTRAEETPPTEGNGHKAGRGIAQGNRLIKEHPVISGILLMGAVVSAIAGSLQFGASLLRFAEGIINDDQAAYSQDYERLRLLSLGSTEEFVEERFGSPWRVERVRIEYIPRAATEHDQRGRMYEFRAPGHVVSLLGDRDGAAIGLAVTSCTEDFRGRVSTPLGPVTLNETTMAGVGQPDTVAYGFPGSSGHGGFLADWKSGDSNSMGYTDVAWGHFTTCLGDTNPQVTKDLQTVTELGDGPFGFVGEYDPVLEPFRSRWIVNGVILLDANLAGETRSLFASFVDGGRNDDLDERNI